jgi:hypothetical protein
VYSSSISRHGEASPSSRSTCHGVSRRPSGPGGTGIMRSGQSRIWRNCRTIGTAAGTAAGEAAPSSAVDMGLRVMLPV